MPREGQSDDEQCPEGHDVPHERARQQRTRAGATDTHPPELSHPVRAGRGVACRQRRAHRDTPERQPQHGPQAHSDAVAAKELTDSERQRKTGCRLGRKGDGEQPPSHMVDSPEPGEHGAAVLDDECDDGDRRQYLAEATYPARNTSDCTGEPARVSVELRSPLAVHRAGADSRARPGYVRPAGGTIRTGRPA